MVKPWADQPYALINTPEKTKQVSLHLFLFPETKNSHAISQISKGVHKVATEMALAHNMFLRLLNAIYLQCTHLTSPADIADLLTLCQAFYSAIHHHHAMEELHFFPAIEKYSGQVGLMDVNVGQHQAFERELEGFRGYVFGVKPEEYDGEKLREVVEKLAGPLGLHLREEIGTLLALEKFGEKELLKAWADLEKAVFADMGDKVRSSSRCIKRRNDSGGDSLTVKQHMILPVGLGANDRTFEGGKNGLWPAFPFFVPYMVKYWYMKKHAGAWRFCPCDVFGQPRELQFLGAEK